MRVIKIDPFAIQLLTSTSSFGAEHPFFLLFRKWIPALPAVPFRLFLSDQIHTYQDFTCMTPNQPTKTMPDSTVLRLLQNN